MQQPNDKIDKLHVKILLAFSAYTNGKKILNTNIPEGDLGILNGIRAICMFWIVLGHYYDSIGGIPNMNTKVISDVSVTAKNLGMYKF